MKFAGVDLERRVPSQMRDGVTLYADVYRPAAAGEYPVLLMRQPYGRMLASTVTYAHPVWFVHQGYMVVIQDVRGRGDSEGQFVPFIDDVADGYDTVEWAAGLTGSNGCVGMYGFSYQGTTQWAAAAAHPPQLKAIAPAMCAADLYQGMFYPHGSFAIGSFLGWAFQLARDEARRQGDRAAEEYCSRLMKNNAEVLEQRPLMKQHPILEKYFPYYYEWVSHPTYDSYWEERNWTKAIVEQPLPALHIGGWFDNYLTGTLQTFELLQGAKAREEHIFHRLIVGPWVHIPWGRHAGGADYGASAAGNLHLEHLKWFDYWLKGEENDLALAPAIRYFELGSNQWRESNELSFTAPPVPQAASSFLLRSTGIPANGASGGGQLVVKNEGAAQSMAAVTPVSVEDATEDGGGGFRVSEVRSEVAEADAEVDSRVDRASAGSDAYAGDVFVCDARLTMPCHSYLPQDRRSLQERYEILNYTSAPLEEVIQVAGSPKLSIWCQALEGPSDLVATLSIMELDGSVRFLSIGRAEIVAGVSEGEEQGWSLLEISLRPMAVQFQQGTALRLELTGSAFPLFVAHPNGMRAEQAPYVEVDQLRMASVAVAFGKERESTLQLPVVQSVPK